MLRRKPIDARQLDLKETVVEVRRVTKVVKGGRNYLHFHGREQKSQSKR